MLFIVTCGLLLIFGVMKIINFAHGGFLTLGGYAPLLATQWGWNAWLGAAARPGGGLALRRGGRARDRAPLHARPLDAILATWGLGIIIGQLITLAFGRGVQFVESPLCGHDVQLLGTDYSVYRLALIVLALPVAGVIAGGAERHAPRAWSRVR